MRTLLLALAVVLPAGTSTPASADDCAAQLDEVLFNSANAGPSHITFHFVSPRNEVHMRGQFVSKGDLHVMLTIDGVTSELIAAGGPIWVRDRDKWRELPLDTARHFSQMFNVLAMDAISQPGDPQCLGAATYDGVEFLSFTYRCAGRGVEGAYDILVDPATMRQIRVEAVFIGGSEGSSTAVVEFDYDRSIEIEPPVL